MMNIGLLAAITLLIFAEKSLLVGVWLSRAVAVVLIAYGLVAVAFPDLLPTVVAQHTQMKM
jgi:predicted metal-binding membrane protein